MKTITFDCAYAGQKIKRIPFGYIDKQLAGIGLTTVALENGINTIVTVPSVSLVRNKEFQYTDGQPKRVRHTVLGVCGGVSDEEIKEYLSDIAFFKHPIKVIVTYDSLHRVRHLLEDADLVVDESDKILGLALLKAGNKTSKEDVDAIDSLLTIAKEHYEKTGRVAFISATPTNVMYMEEWIQKMPQINMNWTKLHKVKPILFKSGFPTADLRKSVILPIKEFGSGKLSNGDSFSKVIVFINSVQGINKIIKRCRLDVKEVAIVCASGLKNDMKIGKYRRLIDVHNLPTYTFCTSTGFSGIDLYDKDALTVVVSSTKKEHTMIGIHQDLRQCASRNRTKENPHFGRVLFIYNQSNFTQTEEELLEEIHNERHRLQNNIDMLNGLKDIEKKTDCAITFNESPVFITYIKENEGVFSVNENLINAHRDFLLNVKRFLVKGFNITGEVDVEEDVSLVKCSNASYVELANYFQTHHKNGVVAWNERLYDAEYIDILNECYKAYGRVWVNYKYAQQKRALIGEPIKQAKALAKVYTAQNTSVSMKEAKIIVGKIYNELGLGSRPKGTILLELLPKSKVLSKRVNGKVMKLIQL